MHNRIVFPLDVATEAEAWEWCFNLRGKVGIMKVGLELFTRLGPTAIRAPKSNGFKVFLDLKLHDIPNTVGKAAEAATALGVDFLSVHASGGAAMMKAAVEAAGDQTKILAITVLTSIAEGDFVRVFNHPVNDGAYVVKKLASVASEGGASGFVCSPLEVEELRKHVGPEATLVVPGVRPKGSDMNDQKRVATPGAAISSGADLLVIGRPIRNAANPQQACDNIASEIAEASS